MQDYEIFGYENGERGLLATVHDTFKGAMATGRELAQHWGSVEVLHNGGGFVVGPQGIIRSAQVGY